ncbi:MAG TPA: hypothetical protein VF160_15205 [Candidatus Dormibacteraeota bacterium]
MGLTPALEATLTSLTGIEDVYILPSDDFAGSALIPCLVISLKVQADDQDALSPGGAIEAAVEAREEGLVRWIGVTGHGTQTAATCRDRSIPVRTIKSVAGRPWLGRPRDHSTSYEPLDSAQEIDLAVWWALGNDQVFVNSVGDVDVLPKFLDAAARFTTPPSDEAMRELVERSRLEPLFV